MELRRLRHVVALAQHGHFAQAADAVHLSQPAFSRSIQSIEEELSVELFVRGQRVIVPTPYGKVVVERAMRLLHAASELKRDIARMKAFEVGEVAMGVGPIPAAILLEPVLTRLSADHPLIRVQVEISHWSNLVRMLEADELDFFIADIRELQSSDHFQLDPMPRLPLHFYCRPNHPLLKANNVPLQRLAECSIGAFKLPATTLVDVTHALQYDGDPSRLISIQCDNMQVLERIARSTDLVVVGPELAYGGAVAMGHLVQISLEAPFDVRTHFGIVRLRGRALSPSAGALIAMAKDVLLGAHSSD